MRRVFSSILLLVSALMGADNTVHYIISSGQSLSIGTGGSPCLSMFQPPLGASGWVSHATGNWPGYNLKMIGNNSVIDFTECRPQSYSTTVGTIAVDTAGNVTGTGTAFTANHNNGILVAGGVERVFTYSNATSGTVSPAPIVALPAGTTFFLSTTGGSFQSFEKHQMGMVNQLTELHPQKDFVSMTIPDGAGGTAYSGLKKGTSVYSTSITRLTEAKNYVTATDAATGRPRPFVVSALDIIHGEADLGSYAGDYVANLRQWLTDYRADAKAITGQTADFPMFTDQYSSWARVRNVPAVWSLSSAPTLPHSSYPLGAYYYNTVSGKYFKNVDNVWTLDPDSLCVPYPSGTCPSTPIAQWWAARDYPKDIYLVGPKYQYRYSDGLHLMNASYRLLGEMHGKAMAKVLHEKKPWIPLAPRSISRQGAAISARFHVPVGCLQFDTTRSDAAVVMTAKTNMGFEYFDSAASATIASVAITSCDTVTITLNTTPTGGSQRLRYAYTGTLGALGGTSSAARGNLADTDPALGLDGLSLRDYGIAFDEPVGFTWEPIAAEVSSSSTTGVTRYVCNSVTDDLCAGRPLVYTAVQTAVDAAGPGDRIVLKAGQVFRPFIVPSGKRDLIIKSSRIDEWPRGYRITRNSGLLAIIETLSTNTLPIRVGEDVWPMSATPGNPVLTSTNGNTGYSVGDKISVSGTYSSPGWCDAATDALFAAADCVPARYGKWFVRYDPIFRNGSVLVVKGGLGNLAETGLVQDQAVYVRDFEYASGYASFNVSATPDGPVIQPAPEMNVVTGLMFEFGPYPLRNESDLYVIAKSSSAPWTLQLSLTRGGPPYTWPQIGALPNPVVAGVNLWKASPPINIQFDGLDVRTASSSQDPNTMIHIFPGKDKRSAPAGIDIVRCWIHGHDDQNDLPAVGVYMAGYQSGVRDSIVEQIYSRSQDTQAVAIANSPGDVLLENNYLSATGMSMMSGGSFPNYMGRIREKMTLRRNYATKPRKWLSSIRGSYVNSTTYRILSVQTNTSCEAEAAAADLSRRCAYHFGSEDGTRHEVSFTGTDVTYTGGTSTGFAWLYGGEDGMLHIRHNLTTGTFTCPVGIDCAYSANPTIPEGAPRLGRLNFTAGALQSSSTGESQLPWTKNLFENKEGNKVLIEGNVMENAYMSYANGGGLQQAMCINATVALNGSGNGPANFLASGVEWIIRNNICRSAGSGFEFNGKAFSQTRREIHGMGVSGNALIENNLLYNLGSKRMTNGQIGNAFRLSNVIGARIMHNTAIDVRQLFNSNPTVSTGVCCGARYLNLEANVFVPWLGTDQTTTAVESFGVYGDAFVDWYQGTHPSVMSIDASTSRMGRNIIMNRNNSSYHTTRGSAYPADYPDSPNTTYCVQTNDPCRNDLTLFQQFTDRNYAASNYRIAKPYSMYPTYTRRLIGADIDEIEALTGRNGADVIAGVPTFELRSGRTIDIGQTSAVLSYTPLSSAPCMYSLWMSSTYQSGNVINFASDSQAKILEGRRVVRMTGLTSNTKYYGKRWCGVDVDVFQFTTLPETPATILGLSAPAGSATVIIQWGKTVDLGKATAPVSCAGGSTCSITVPATAGYYRHIFRNNAGNVIAIGDIRTHAAE